HCTAALRRGIRGPGRNRHLANRRHHRARVRAEGGRASARSDPADRPRRLHARRRLARDREPGLHDRKRPGNRRPRDHERARRDVGRLRHELLPQRDAQRPARRSGDPRRRDGQLRRSAASGPQHRRLLREGRHDRPRHRDLPRQRFGEGQALLTEPARADDGAIDLSVGIPAHNEAANIAGLLADLSAQRLDGRSLEIVVVDDASTDATRRIVEEHAARDPRVRLVAHPERRGSTAGWNSVFAACRGAVCVKLDGDVRVPQPDFLLRVERALALGDADLAYCRVVPREPPASFVQRGSSFIYRYLAEQNRTGHATSATLFAAMLAATRRFYASYRIDEAVVANDYYTARYARSKGVGITIADDAVVTVRTARTVADFRKQAQR